MSAKLERTQTAGIYQRGSRYVVPWRDYDGVQHWETVSSLAEARSVRAARLADRDRGKLPILTQLSLRTYALEWIERYQGRGRRGFRDQTRDEYRRLLERDVLPAFPSALLISRLSPLMIAEWIGALAATDLADQTIRNRLSVLQACLSSAVREGVLASNPARDIDLPCRDAAAREPARTLTAAELEALVDATAPEWQIVLRLLAETGLRISELVGLQWQHVTATDVLVRRRIVRGRVGPPKSRYGRRDVPLPTMLADELDSRRSVADEPVFASRTRTPVIPSNLLTRVLAPAREEAGVPWAGFHTLRHTYASRLIAEGTDVVQVQRRLGHHSAAFTLSTYAHLWS